MRICNPVKAVVNDTIIPDLGTCLVDCSEDQSQQAELWKFN